MPTKGYVTRSTRSQAELLALSGDVLSATAEQTISELPSVSIYRMSKLAAAELSGNRLTLDQASERLKSAGLEGQLKLTDGMSPESLEILMQRKKDEIRRADLMSRSPGGVGMGAAKLGTALATSLLDPVNIATAFVPVVGQARYASWLAKAGGAWGRAGVRVGVGAVEGAVGAAIVEPLIYAAKTQEQADYDMLDSLLNVAFGTVFGGGLHVTAGGIGDAAGALRRRRVDVNTAAAKVDAAGPVQRESALRTAVNQSMVGRVVDVEPLFVDRSHEPKASTVAHEARDFGEHSFKTDKGELLAQESGEYLLVKRSDVEAEARGQGQAVAMYEAAKQKADDLGLKLGSDISVSPDAERVYRSLQRRGYDIIENPATRNPETGNLVSDSPRVPVFEVGQKAAPDTVPARDTSAETAAEVVPRRMADKTVQAAKASADRLASPESDVTADVRAADLADKQLVEVPRETDPIAEQEALITDAAKELKEVARINGADIKEDLAELDELVKQAETYGKAARAAVLCGLGH